MQTANHQTSTRKNWVPMLKMKDGRLMLGQTGMTYIEACDEAEAERTRLESTGQPVDGVGVWNRKP